MPNWCTQNLAIVGKENEIKDFVELVNSLPSREPAAKNGFGPFWLGNLVRYLGEDWEKISCRGCISDGGGFFGPGDLSEGRIPYNGGDTVFLNFVSAWGPCDRLLDLIRERYSSFVIYHEETDEFGNFHTRYDPMNLLSGGKYRMCCSCDDDLETDDIKQFCKAIADAYNRDFDMDCEDDDAEKWLNDIIAEENDDGEPLLSGDIIVYEDLER